MSKFNLTVDDFDPVVHYANHADWETPNPQDNPTWWNATQEVTKLPWHQATYHKTAVKGAQASFNFTGSGLWIYGAGGSGSNYTITLDPQLEKPFSQSYAPSGNDTGRALLYGADNLANAQHQVVITNEGSELLLDLFVVQTELGGEGATITNRTLDDRASEIKYNGEWTGQNGPNFFNQTSTYTGADASMEVEFAGSAVWIYGDQVNDHGEFTVAINGTEVATNNGRSGCGGGWAKHCEKLHGLAFLASGLPAGTHTLKITNKTPTQGNQTFFDFDYLEYAVPSMYAAAPSSPGSCPFTTCDGNVTSGGSPTSSPSSKPSNAADSLPSGTAALVAVLGAWALRALF